MHGVDLKGWSFGEKGHSFSNVWSGCNNYNYLDAMVYYDNKCMGCSPHPCIVVLHNILDESIIWFK